VLNCPTAIASGIEAAQAVVRTVTGRRRSVLTNWLGATAATAARREFSAARIPTYETPDDAVRGFMHLVRYRHSQEQLMEVPPATAPESAPNRDRARSIADGAIAQGRGWLTEPEVTQLLALYDIPAVRSAIVDSPAAAAAKAADYGGRIALKIFSPDIVHKSDVGGVMLDLAGADAVQAAAETKQRRVAQAAPEARLAGFVVQEMIHRPMAHELILGMAVDAQFGPFLLFGQGGTGAEVIADRALALPPLNPLLAREMMSRTRIYRQLEGYRNRPPADLDVVARILVNLSHLVCDLDEVAEIDLNPLLADAAGAIVLDARIRVVPPAPDARRGSRLAIPAYPRHLERSLTLPALGPVLLRPVRPEDGPAFTRLFDSLSPEDVHLRFFSRLDRLSKNLVARFTQIDYDREMAFVLELPAPERAIAGIARLVADPDNHRAEFAITVRSDLKGRGLGTLLMRHLLAYGRERGLDEIVGDILSENQLMLALARDFGFTLAPLSETPQIVRATLTLDGKEGT
jgi:acetyltransferase